MSDTTTTEPADDAGATTATVPEAAADADLPREAIESPEDRLIDSVTASQQEALDTVEQAGNAAVAGVGLLQRAMADFVGERLRQDLETQRALLACRSLAEVRTVGFAHWRTAADQYGRELSHMAGLGAEVARQSLARPRFPARGA